MAYTFKGYGEEFIGFLKKCGWFEYYVTSECDAQGFEFPKLYNHQKTDGLYMFSMPGMARIGMKHYWVYRRVMVCLVMGSF